MLAMIGTVMNIEQWTGGPLMVPGDTYLGATRQPAIYSRPFTLVKQYSEQTAGYNVALINKFGSPETPAHWSTALLTVILGHMSKLLVNSNTAKCVRSPGPVFARTLMS